MYNYQSSRPRIFTEEGQVLFLAIRDNVHRLCKLAGCVKASWAWRDQSGSTDDFLASLDRLVELGEVREISPPDCWGQDRIFVLTK